MAASPPPPPDTTLTATVTDPAHPDIHGTTNLPDETLLSVDVTRPDGSLVARAGTTVRGGGFAAGPLTQDGHALPPGEYAVEVRMDILNQPKSVQRVVGSHGMKLHGPLTQLSSSGQYVDYTTRFKVPGAPAPTEAATAGGDQTWAAANCERRLDFLNRTIRDGVVSGQPITGEAGVRWLTDCERESSAVPNEFPDIP